MVDSFYNRNVARLAHNLSHPLTRLVGRTRELADLRQLLYETRLLTLTGAGGVGKTRLALALAHVLLDAPRARKLYPDGVWLVELAGIPDGSADPAVIPQAVLNALGIPAADARSPNALLVDYLRDRQLLLLLDNCEHLVAACAAFVREWLNASAGLRVLATSREALRVEGELMWLVPSLGLPEAEAADDLEQLGQAEAVQLFVERARAAVPTFGLTVENARAVAEICRRLDGIPLALELAAARVKVMSTQEIVARLGEPRGASLNWLSTDARAVLPRQQAMRAAIEWSYGLLSPEERVLFRRLGIFAGSFSFDAVQASADAEIASSVRQQQANQLLMTYPPAPLPKREGEVIDQNITPRVMGVSQ